jgi:1,4-dihydroxy-2-naphthoyl-CoA synthase
VVNEVVADADLDAAVVALLERATRGSAASKALGKQTLYRQLGLDEPDAYVVAAEAMAISSQHPDAREGMRAFIEKRHPNF